MHDFDSTRAQFLRNTGKGAVGLVVGGSVLAMAEGVAFGQTSGDVEIAKVAATAELLAIDVYTRALAARSGGKVIFAGATRQYLTTPAATRSPTTTRCGASSAPTRRRAWSSSTPPARSSPPPRSSTSA